MKLVCISDTHEQHRDLGTLPDGDVLIHAGDFTYRGDLGAIEDFNAWLGEQPHSVKIVIAGNHELTLDPWSRHRKAARALITNATYLQDSSAVVTSDRSYLFYGSPWTPRFFNWAFQADPTDRAWTDKISEFADVLITHGPPHGILDGVPRYKSLGEYALEHCGSHTLKFRVEKIRPKIHIFGHIHEGHGIHPTSDTIYVNACSVDEHYKIVHAPIVVSL